ncbi:UNVERIFIED_CONTAM: hypothetical protein Sradi_2560700 [Sesamum radiatum]|uniref:Uncharacterized protein n=1 Tax=Sesamum radiatum TaxID=300843 RepID=A0AAW2SMK9_SESRA
MGCPTVADVVGCARAILDFMETRLLLLKIGLGLEGFRWVDWAVNFWDCRLGWTEGLLEGPI